MPSKYKTLTEALKKAIEASGMTTYRLSKESGVSQPVIARFLAGERDIRLATADKLAVALDLELRKRK